MRISFVKNNMCKYVKFQSCREIESNRKFEVSVMMQ